MERIVPCKKCNKPTRYIKRGSADGYQRRKCDACGFVGVVVWKPSWVLFKQGNEETYRAPFEPDKPVLPVPEVKNKKPEPAVKARRPLSSAVLNNPIFKALSDADKTMIVKRWDTPEIDAMLARLGIADV